MSSQSNLISLRYLLHSFHDLEDGISIDVRADTTAAVSRGAGEEEEPSVPLTALLRQLLQVEHLFQLENCP
jgi:hypothetical protein